MIIEREWAMPNKNTFSIPPINKLILEEKEGKNWIDPFAGDSCISCAVTNDLNPQFPTSYHMNAVDFLREFEDGVCDGVLFDPPYSPRQISECYHGIGKEVYMCDTQGKFWSDCKKEIGRIVKVGGKVISFGWNSGGIGKKYGFDITRILLVAHGGWHNDTICTVEVKNYDW